MLREDIIKVIRDTIEADQNAQCGGTAFEADDDTKYLYVDIGELDLGKLADDIMAKVVKPVPQKTYAVEGPKLPEGPTDLVIIGNDDGSVTRLAKWPEGLCLWHKGELVWKAWAKCSKCNGKGELNNDPLSPCDGCSASDQPVEAVGAGLEDVIEGLRATLARPDCQFLRIERSGAQRILAALSPASPARTPMGGEVEALREEEGNILDGESFFIIDSEGEWRVRRDPPSMPVVPVEDGVLQEAINQIGALLSGGVTGRTHDVWDRAERSGLNKAKRILEALAASSPSPAQGGEVEALREAVARIAAEEKPSFGNGNTNDLLARQFWTIANEAVAASSPSPAQGALSLPKALATMSYRTSPATTHWTVEAFYRTHDEASEVQQLLANGNREDEQK